MTLTSRARTSRRGVSLVEMMLVLLLTGMIFGVTQALLAGAIDSWWKVNANADAEQQLYKAQNFLERDISSAAYEREAGRETLRIEKRAPASSLVGADGDVLWFLSAIDPASGQIVRRPSGEPFWQRNIVYYCVTPNDLNQFGFSGSGVERPPGYEVGCPYKILVRLEIDHGIATNPDPLGGTEEALLTFDQLLPYLGRPDGYDTGSLGSPNTSVRPISGNIVSFWVDHEATNSGISVDLRAASVARLRREGTIGNKDLADDPSTQQLQISLYPPNRQGLTRTDGN